MVLVRDQLHKHFDAPIRSDGHWPCLPLYQWSFDSRIQLIRWPIILGYSYTTIIVSLDRAEIYTIYSIYIF